MNSPAAFNATCAALLERVTNIVPNGVSLTEQINLLPFKVHDARLTVQNGALVFVIEVRVSNPYSVLKRPNVDQQCRSR